MKAVRETIKTDWYDREVFSMCTMKADLRWINFYNQKPIDSHNNIYESHWEIDNNGKIIGD